MEPRSDEILETTLRALRPTPTPAFAAKLDARAAAGFPAARPSRLARMAGALGRLRAVPPRQLLATAGALGLAAIVATTAVVAISGGGADSTTEKPESSNLLSDFQGFDGSTTQSSDAAGHASSGATGETRQINPTSAASATVVPTSKYVPLSKPIASHANHRQIERSAQIVLGADSSQLRDDAAEVFSVVHDSDGIVLSSSIRDGGTGAASAHFELLIPSAQLDDALAGLSQIDEVRSRSDATTDVTAPAIGLGERLRDSNAKIEGLLAQLAGADTDAERATVETQLRDERQRAAALRARLTTLQRHVHFSRVSVRIESGSSASGSADGSWDIGDALHDAGRILAIAAGVTLIGLAIVGPLALLCLVAWFAHRIWVRRRRESALG